MTGGARLTARITTEKLRNKGDNFNDTKPCYNIMRVTWETTTCTARHQLKRGGTKNTHKTNQNIISQEVYHTFSQYYMKE
jgi:hypothetical protein